MPGMAGVEWWALLGEARFGTAWLARRGIVRRGEAPLGEAG